ncbi:MAG: SprB repeat-containing protein [Flavobacteriales bacterium]|nr:SprB repeat-containing protein [Flavobacteriales bacterium]
MTRTLRALAFFQALVVTTAAQALSVSVTKTDEYCDGANGAMWANVSGGIEPYTYLWSNGATTESIYDLVAGTYSVTVTDFVGTQATDGANILSYASFPPTDLGGARAYCPGGFEYVHSVFSQIWLYEVNLGLPMLPPFTLQGVTAIDMIGFDGYQLVLYGPPGPADGSSSQFTYTDANGCPGDVTLHVGYGVDFPVMSVLNVEAACASAANGSIQVALTPEGHDQSVELELKRSNGQVVATRYTGQQASIEMFTGLVPDDYRLVQRIRSVGLDEVWQQLRNVCGDSLMVTVADLGANCGNVNGTVYMDYNEDCVMGNSSETRVPGALLEFTPGPYYATANGVGAYSLNLPSGAYAMQQIAAGIAQHCPAPPAPVNVSGVQTINVGDTAVVPVDAEVMIASGAARPGFVLQYAIQQSNLTPATTGATSTVMTFDPTVTFITANPTPSLISGTTLTWNQAALGAFQQRTIYVQFQVPPDVGLIGNVLSASVSLSTANTDAVGANNSASTSVTITASFDPNDKTARTSSQWSNDFYYINVDNWIDQPSLPRTRARTRPSRSSSPTPGRRRSTRRRSNGERHRTHACAAW